MVSEIHLHISDEIVLIEDFVGLNKKNSITSSIISPDLIIKRTVQLPNFNKDFINEIQQVNLDESISTLLMVAQGNYNFSKTNYGFLSDFHGEK